MCETGSPWTGATLPIKRRLSFSRGGVYASTRRKEDKKGGKRRLVSNSLPLRSPDASGHNQLRGTACQLHGYGSMETCEGEQIPFCVVMGVNISWRNKDDFCFEFLSSVAIKLDIFTEKVSDFIHQKPLYQLHLGLISPQSHEGMLHGYISLRPRVITDLQCILEGTREVGRAWRQEELKSALG